MSGVHFTCGLCGRKASVGVLSRNAWGEVVVNGDVARACPTCCEKKGDWQSQLAASSGGEQSEQG